MDLTNKNILVTGGTGFIGINLIQRFLSLNISNIRATIHKTEPIINDDRIEYVKCDLLKMEDCKKVVKDIDFIFNCAAETHGAAIIKSNPISMVTPNIIMNAQILEASYISGVNKFVFISSNAAYPPTGTVPTKEEDMFNGDPYDAYFGVGWMKRYTEKLCQFYDTLNPKMSTVVVRPSNIYGPFDDFDFATSHVMAATIRKVIEKKNPIEVWGDGNDVRDLIYIDDFIDGLLLATEKLNKLDPINIGYGKCYSIKEILQIALEIDGSNNTQIIYDSSKPSMIPIRLIDTQKAEKLLNFKAQTDIREGIKKTIDWYKQQYAIYT